MRPAFRREIYAARCGRRAVEEHALALDEFTKSVIYRLKLPGQALLLSCRGPAQRATPVGSFSTHPHRAMTQTHPGTGRPRCSRFAP